VALRLAPISTIIASQAIADACVDARPAGRLIPAEVTEEWPSACFVMIHRKRDNESERSSETQNEKGRTKMKSTLSLVAVLTIVAVAIFMMGAPMADAGCGYGYGYSSYCAPCYNTYYTPVYNYCAPVVPYFNPCYRGW